MKAVFQLIVASFCLSFLMPTTAQGNELTVNFDLGGTTNISEGTSAFAPADVMQTITSVTIASPTLGGNWNFAIDTLTFNHPVHELYSIALAALGGLSLAAWGRLKWRLLGGMSRCLAFWILAGATAYADVTVSTGYNDTNGIGLGVPSPGITVPDPWYGSPNTTFFGNAADIISAQATDPDISAVLFQNTGSSTVTIQDVNITSEDLFIRAGLVSTVTLGPGQNAIFAIGDGSEDLLSLQTVGFELDGQSYSVSDATTTSDGRFLRDGVLTGGSEGFNCETVPWTQIAPVPEPSTATLLTTACMVFAFMHMRPRGPR